MRREWKLHTRVLRHTGEYQEIVEQVEEVHPFITRYMKFLNTDDNAELARLDAERAKEKRLQAISES